MINKKLFKELKSENNIYKIKTKDGFLSCPCCKNKMLRACEEVILCYNCGTLFKGNEIVRKYKGDRRKWWDNVLSEFERYVSDTVKGRIKQYVNYLRDRQLKFIDPNTLRRISDKDVLECYQHCHECEEELYTESQLRQAVMEFNSPSKTFDALIMIMDKHFIKEMLGDYDPVDYGEDTWTIDKKYKNIFVSPEMRQFLAKEVAKKYRAWVDSDHFFTVSHENDPSWDCSGELVRIDALPSAKLQFFEDIVEWSENAYTGESYPSYESGCGMSHVIFWEEIYSFVSNKLWEIWTKKVDKDAFRLELEKNNLFDKVFDLEVKLLNMIGGMSVIEAYKLGETN